MYLSHPVRRMRDDPFEDERAELRVHPETDEAQSELTALVSELGGTVGRELQFGGVIVVVEEADVSALCELDAIERIETSDTLGY
ncbi:hypothetical protein [Haloferax sp. DFSO60]|uniref:hypothetical protein n=1 Tax=Haloferax sp. DFSO60 TaxID=3388652 RepID=UPI0039789070